MKALVMPVIVVGVAALVLAACGSDEEEGAAAARPAGEPVEFALEPAHRSGVTGRARLVSDGANLKVTLTLDDRAPDTRMAHIHTGPCSEEPTLTNPRIWANLHDVIDSRSETTVNVVTLAELQAESSSINVHDPEHANRPLVCGDIPRAD
jgi:hypothetical protein